MLAKAQRAHAPSCVFGIALLSLSRMGTNDDDVGHVTSEGGLPGDECARPARSGLTEDELRLSDGVFCALHAAPPALLLTC